MLHGRQQAGRPHRLRLLHRHQNWPLHHPGGGGSNHTWERLATVFQAEMAAIHNGAMAAKTLLRDRLITGPVTFKSDSQAAVLALRNPVVTSTLVGETKTSPQPAGNNLHGRRGVDQGTCRPQRQRESGCPRQGGHPHAIQEGPQLLFLPVPLNLVKGEIKAAMRKTWTRRWQRTTECRQTRQFFPEPNKRRAAQLFKESRPTFGRMVRLLTGHDFLRKHQGVTGLNQGSTKCRWCHNYVESSWHILMECGALSAERFKQLDSYLLPAIPGSMKKFITFRMLPENQGDGTPIGPNYGVKSASWWKAPSSPATTPSLFNHHHLTPLGTLKV